MSEFELVDFATVALTSVQLVAGEIDGGADRATTRTLVHGLGVVGASIRESVAILFLESRVERCGLAPREGLSHLVRPMALAFRGALDRLQVGADEMATDLDQGCRPWMLDPTLVQMRTAWEDVLEAAAVLAYIVDRME